MNGEKSVPGDPKPHLLVAEKDGAIESRETATTPVQAEWTVEGALKQFNLPTHKTPPTSPLAFYHLIERLKTTPREGWRRFGLSGIHRGESISDHMYRMSLIVLTAPATLTSRLDIPRCTRMALIHDLAEALVGDITPADNIAKTEKSRRETETIDYVADQLLGSVRNGGMEAGRALREVWTEYEESVTAESHFVHDVDKLELLLQMVEYEKAASTKESEELGEFSRVADKIVLPEMKHLAAEVLQERIDFWTANGGLSKSGRKPDRLEENKRYVAANLMANGTA